MLFCIFNQSRPKHLKPNTTSNKMFSSIDLLPTLSNLASIELPNNPIDGKNIWSLISGTKGVENPHDYYAFSNSNSFQGVISGDGKWKLHIPHQYRTLVSPGKDGNSGKYVIKTIELSLFDMENNPYESENVIEKYPQITKQLLSYVKSHENQFYNTKNTAQ